MKNDFILIILKLYYFSSISCLADIDLDHMNFEDKKVDEGYIVQAAGN